MENRRVLPEMFFKGREKGELTDTDPYPKNLSNTKDPDEVEKYEQRQEMKKKYPNPRGREMKRSYTIDEMTSATMLKGHPQAEEILDMLNKGKKRNESGEEFQDGSEDSIGSEGHASPARPGTIKHEGGGEGPDEPGTATEDEDEPSESSFGRSRGTDNDLEKSDNLADNLPEEFEDEMEDDDTIPAEPNAKKSLDDECVDFLVKTMGQDKAEEFLKAGTAASIYTTPGALSAKRSGGYEGVKLMGEIDKHKAGQPSDLDPKKPDAALDSLKSRLGTADTQKSIDDSDENDDSEDTEKSKKGTQTAERAEWAKDPEKEKREHMSEKSYSLDFSKSILVNMGLEKGSPSVSKKVSGGKATQISYSSKPETRFKHPKQKTGETRYEHNVKEGTVTKKEATGEKGKFKEGKPIGVSEESKLKNASSSSDLLKSLDAILSRKRDQHEVR